MKNLAVFFLCFTIVACWGRGGALAGELSKTEILAELQELKIRMQLLERALGDLPGEVVETAEASGPEIHAEQKKVRPSVLRQGERGVAGHLRALDRSLKDPAGTGAEPGCRVDTRISESEDNRILRQGERGVTGHWQALRQVGEGLEISGAVEIEASYERLKARHEKRRESSDIELATVELGVDAFISESLRAHLIFAYDEDAGSVEIDEAMLHYQAVDVCQPDSSCNSPWFASLGKMTVPFGYYESHFISDPLTSVLGETQEVAALAGIHGGAFTLAAGIYNGDLDIEGKADHIDRLVAASFLHLDEAAVSGLALTAGISYISNIADSCEMSSFFSEELERDTLQERVGGVSAFLSLGFKELFFLELEWVSALEKFKEAENFAPKAWNLELAYRPLEIVEVGLRYSGSDDAMNFLPEKQLGVIAAYEIYENTSIGIEYLYEEYENRDKVNRVTTQLGVEF